MTTPVPEPQPGTAHLAATFKRLSDIDSKRCDLDRNRTVRQCYHDGDLVYIGESWPGGGVRRRLAMCQLCHAIHPLDTLEEESA